MDEVARGRRCQPLDALPALPNKDSLLLAVAVERTSGACASSKSRRRPRAARDRRWAFATGAEMISTDPRC